MDEGGGGIFFGNFLKVGRNGELFSRFSPFLPNFKKLSKGRGLWKSKVTYPALSFHSVWGGANITKGENAGNKQDKTKLTSGSERDRSTTHAKRKVTRVPGVFVVCLCALRRVLGLFVLGVFAALCGVLGWLVLGLP